jgi:hypothetical protein
VPFVSSNVISDANGRYIIVLANVYASNWDEEKKSFVFLSSRPRPYDSYLLILGGDFNCLLNPTLDCSSNKISTPKSAKVTQTFLEEFAVTDPWRFFSIQLVGNINFLPCPSHFPTLPVGPPTDTFFTASPK